MITLPNNNPDLTAFYAGNGVFPGGATRSNLGAMRRARRRGVGSLGSVNASSSSPDSGSSGTSLTDIASAASTLATTASNTAKSVLQAEAAQNAINAQKNLTAALTPGVITIGLAVLAYWLVVKK